MSEAARRRFLQQIATTGPVPTLAACTPPVSVETLIRWVPLCDPAEVEAILQLGDLPESVALAILDQCRRGSELYEQVAGLIPLTPAVRTRLYAEASGHVFNVVAARCVDDWPTLVRDHTWVVPVLRAASRFHPEAWNACPQELQELLLAAMAFCHAIELDRVRVRLQQLEGPVAIAIWRVWRMVGDQDTRRQCMTHLAAIPEAVREDPMVAAAEAHLFTELLAMPWLLPEERETLLLLLSTIPTTPPHAPTAPEETPRTASTPVTSAPPPSPRTPRAPRARRGRG